MVWFGRRPASRRNRGRGSARRCLSAAGAPPAIEALEFRALPSISGTSFLLGYLAPGASYTYASTAFNSDSSTTYDTTDSFNVKGPATAPGGQASIELDTKIVGPDGTGVGQLYYGASGDGIVEYEDDIQGNVSSGSTTDTQTYTPPQLAMPATLTAGQAVNSSSTDANHHVDTKGTATDTTSTDTEQFTLISETPQSITVPAGTFNAYEVDVVSTESSTDPSGNSQASTDTEQDWYAPRIGLVKSVESSAGSDVVTTIVLNSYSIPPDTLQFAAQPANTPAGKTIAPISVDLLDKNGKVDTTSSAAVTLLLQGGKGALGGTATVNAVNGVATFSDLSVKVPGKYTLLASSSAATSVTSNPFQILGDHLVFTTQPADASPNASIPMVVTVEDPNNNTDTTAGGSIDLTLNTVSGRVNAALGGTISAPVTNGVATFTTSAGPTINAPGAYTITATQGGVDTPATDATSAQFTVSVSLTWTGKGDGTNWSDPKNWAEDEKPANGDSLVFPSGSPLSPSNDIGGLSIARIDIQGSGYTLTGDAISLTGGLTSEAGNNTYNIPTDLVGSPTLDDQTGDLTIQSDLTGDGLTYAGGGTFTLDQADDYSGTTTLAAGVTIQDLAGTGAFGTGTVVIGGGSSAVSLDAGENKPATIDNDIEFQDGSTLDTDPIVQFAGNIKLDGAALIDPIGPKDEVDLYGAKIEGTGTMTAIGGGTLRVKAEIAATVKLVTLTKLTVYLDAPTLDGTQGQDQVDIVGGTAYLMAGTKGSGGIVLSGSTMQMDPTSGAGAPGYSGTVTVTGGGKLEWQRPDDRSSAIGAGTLVLAGGTLDILPVSEDTVPKNNTVVIPNPILLQGDMTVNAGATPVDFTGVITVKGADTVTIQSTGTISATDSGTQLVTFDSSAAWQDGGSGGPVTFKGSPVNLLGPIAVPVILSTDNLPTMDAPAQALTAYADYLGGTLTASLSIESSEEGFTAAITQNLSGTGDIRIDQGVLGAYSASSASPGLGGGYSGTVTLAPGGTIAWLPKSINGGLGNAKLDLLGGTLQSLVTDPNQAPTLSNDITLEADELKIDLGSSGLFFEGTTTVKAASTITVSGGKDVALVYDKSNDPESPPSTSILMSQGDDQGNIVNFQGQGAVKLLGRILAPVFLTSDNAGGGTQDVLGGNMGGTTQADGKKITGTDGVTIEDPKTSVVLTSDLSGRGPIYVNAGTLATDTSGTPYGGGVTLGADGTIQWNDTQNSNDPKTDGIGTGILDIQGGTLSNMIGTGLTSATFGQDIWLDGNVKIAAGATGVVFHGTTTILSPSVVTIDTSGGGTVAFDQSSILQSQIATTGQAGPATPDVVFEGSAVELSGTIAATVGLQSTNIPASTDPNANSGGTSDDSGPQPDVLAATLNSPGKVIIQGLHTLVAIQPLLHGDGAITVAMGTLVTRNALRNYSGQVTLQSSGIIQYGTNSTDPGLGTGTLEIQGGRLTSLVLSSNSAAPDLINPITLKGDVILDIGSSGLSFHGTTTVAAACTVTVVSNSDSNMSLTYDNSSILTGAIQDPSGGQGPATSVTFSGLPVQLLGTISTPVDLQSENTPSNTRDELAGKLTGAGQVTVDSPQTVAFLTAGLQSDATPNVGDITVVQGALVTDTTDAPNYHGWVILQGGTIHDYDASGGEGQPLGTGTLILEGGNLENTAGATVTIANPVEVSGSASIISNDNPSNVRHRLKIAGPLTIDETGQLEAYGTIMLTATSQLKGSGLLSLWTEELDVASSNPGFTGHVNITGGDINFANNLARHDGLGKGTADKVAASNADMDAEDVIGDPILDNPIEVQAGTLTFDGQYTFTSGLTIDAGAAVIIKGANTQVIVSGPLAGGGDLILQGGSFAAPGGTASYAGHVQLQGGLITPTLTVSEAGGAADGSPFAARAMLSAPGLSPSGSIQGVMPTLLYYVGDTATGTGSTTPPSSPGTYTVVASFSGVGNYTAVQSVPVTFVIAPARAANHLVFVVQPHSARAGARERVVVLIENGAGQVVSTDDSTVTLSIADRPQAFGSRVTARARHGVAVFRRIPTTAGRYSLVATDGDDAPAVSRAFRIASAAPAKLAFARPPARFGAGHPIGPVVVKVEDRYGNRATRFDSSITLWLGHGRHGGTFLGTAEVRRGEAIFVRRVLTTPGRYALVATDDNGDIVVSRAFQIAPADPKTRHNEAR